MAKKLVTLFEYINAPRGLHYRPGDVIEPSDADYLFLMADAPGCFAEYVAPAKAIDAPPVDKMLRQPKVKK